MYNKAINILKMLNKYGFEGYIVGGYPRDKYLGIESNDIDICTNARVEDLENIFKIDKEYKEYGNVVVDGIQITTYRKDTYLKNRNDVIIEYVDSLKEDLNRRDFIMNTLCIDINGNYVDLMGAKEDIDNKIIRMVGSTDRLKEDPLRILRALRFKSELKFNLDDELESAIIKYSYLVNDLSHCKYESELKRIDKELIDKYLR